MQPTTIDFGELCPASLSKLSSRESDSASRCAVAWDYRQVVEGCFTAVNKQHMHGETSAFGWKPMQPRECEEYEAQVEGMF